MKMKRLLSIVVTLCMVLSLLPVGVLATTEQYVELTVDSLGLVYPSYSTGTNNIDGVAVEWIQLGNYGSGIQMRDKTDKTSMLWNTAPLPGGITKIELTYSSSKEVMYANADAVIFNFGNEAKGATYSTKLSTIAGVKTYTITPDANTYTYFYMEHDLMYTMYWDSIKVYYDADGSIVEPGDDSYVDTLDQPELVDDYYQIQTADQLYWFSNQVYAEKNDINGKLMADIVVNENVLTADGKLNSGAFRVWKPIGNGVTPYAGTFDGNGHTISGLYFNDASKTQIGLFGSVGGTVKNVALLDSYLNGYKFVGGIAGENVGTIYSCFSTATVIGSFSVGGVAGYNSGTVTNCFYLTGRAPANNIGGSRTADEFAMGEVAYLLQGEQTEHIWGQSIGTDPMPKRGGEKVYMVTTCDGYGIGYSNDPNAQLGHLYQQEVYPATCTEGGFTVFTCSLCGDTYIGDEVEPLNHPEYVDGFCALCGSGQPAVENGDYYEISNVAQLYWFAEQVNGGNTDINGKLMNDIVVNENVLKEDGTLNGDGSGFKVWTPIGNNVKKYSGTFDGNGKTVSGLYFSDSEQNFVGLFGYVDSGCVQNVGVVDSYLSGDKYVGGVVGCNSNGKVNNSYNTGSVSGSDFVGGVVGINHETVSNCYNTGSVSGSDFVGGVVGYNDYSPFISNSYGTVSNSYNTGSVSGSDYVGGVVGHNDYGTVSNCYNTGSVSGGERVGGVVGFNSKGTVSDCYNTGNVSGSRHVGGVAGYNYGTVSNSYNTGSVSGGKPEGDAVGGVVGYNDYGTVSNCYNTGSVSSSSCVGGVVGHNYHSTVSNSYNTGSVSGSYGVGGVVGYNKSYSTVSNSYNTGSVSGYDYVGSVVGDNDATSSVQNCYYRTGCAKDGDNKIQFGIGCETVGSNVRDTAGITIGKTTDAFASGEVCVLLQGEQTDPIWGQIIGTDPSPVLGGEPVYAYNGNYFNKDGLPHEHEYEAVITAPTCESDGYTTYTCTFCGDSYQSDVVTAPGHSWVDANCQSAKTCTVCGITEGGLGDHGYNKVVTAPTCTSDGYTTYTCKFCNHTYNGDFIFATGHSWTEADCTQPMRCEVCAITRGEALGHIFGEVTIHKPTAEAQGYSEHSCTICGFNEKFDFVEFRGVTISGQLTGYLEGDTTIELIQDGEVIHSATVSGGEYAIEGVAAGEYTLRISKANHAPVEMDITVGEEPVTFDATICPVGDVTGDGNVNIKDFQRLLRHVNKTNPLTDYELSCGDVTGDGVCNIKDFQRLLRHVNKTNPLFSQSSQSENTVNKKEYRVVVKDSNGNPLSGVYISICKAGSVVYAPQRTDENGCAVWLLDEASDYYGTDLQGRVPGVYFGNQYEVTLVIDPSV